MAELGDVERGSGFEFLAQVRRELADRSTPRVAVLADLRDFEIAWSGGDPPQQLGARFRFRKVHDAECTRRGILLYEISVDRSRYRAVVAWFGPEEPGRWVAIFKKQGDSQSKTSLRTAGERAVNHWRQTHGH